MIVFVSDIGYTPLHKGKSGFPILILYWFSSKLSISDYAEIGRGFVLFRTVSTLQSVPRSAFISAISLSAVWAG